MNKSVIKTIILILLSLLSISGCGWEDESNDSGTDTTVKPNLIQFVSTTSDKIALKGTGNSVVSETATVTFKVYGTSGAILSGASINMSLSSDVGGITLSGTTVISDSNGEITVKVTSGTTITNFTVIATAADNSSVTASSSEIKITSASVKSLQFLSVSSDLIALKGTGGSDLTETTELKFRAIDETGNVVTGALINFATNTIVGGLSLSSNSQKTDSNGEVKVNVISGTIPTSVSVVASLNNDPNIRVISNNINISTGRATYRGFSMGPEGSNHVVGALDTFGIEKKIIVQASDLFSNPVPNGTVINFRAAWGLIDPSCAMQGGQCSVTWRSGGDRTVLFGQNPLGRVTIVASVIGEESFTDVNSNGLYDSEDYAVWDPTKDNLSEMFINKNDMDNGYDYGIDEFIDDNANGLWDAAPNEIYNGKLCSDSAEAGGLCSKDLIRIWRSNVIIPTFDSPVTSSTINLFNSNLTQASQIDLRGVASKTYYVEVKDINGNPLPEGTEITFSVTKPDGTANSNAVIEKSSYKLTNHTDLGIGSTLFQVKIDAKDKTGADLDNNSVFVVTVKGNGDNSKPYYIRMI